MVECFQWKSKHMEWSPESDINYPNEQNGCGKRFMVHDTTVFVNINAIKYVIYPSQDAPCFTAV